MVDDIVLQTELLLALPALLPRAYYCKVMIPVFMSAFHIIVWWQSYRADLLITRCTWSVGYVTLNIGNIQAVKQQTDLAMLLGMFNYSPFCKCKNVSGCSLLSHNISRLLR